MPLAGGETRVIAQLFGGQGTMNTFVVQSRSVASLGYGLIKKPRAP